MNNLRLYYRVILKLLTFMAIIVLSSVFINSLFVNSKSTLDHSKRFPVVVLDISLMKKGDIRKTRWKGKEVAVLFRDETPSKEPYFVYENHGDSGNCPLFYVSNTFKDVCTGQLFDTFGRQKVNPKRGYRLKVPPHYFNDQEVLFGINQK